MKRTTRRSLIISFVCIINAIIFVGGFHLNWYILHPEMTEEQYTVCENIANGIYERGLSKTEIPHEVTVTITTDSTTNIKYKDQRGSVTLNNTDGNISRDNQTAFGIFYSIMSGIVAILLTISIILLILFFLSFGR